MSELKNKIKTLQKQAVRVLELYENQLSPSKDTRYDKTDFGFGTEPATHNLHNVIYFRHHSGTYGNSSVSSVFSDTFTEFVAKAIDEQKEKIVYRASELMLEEAKKMIEELRAERDEFNLLIEELEVGDENI